MIQKRRRPTTVRRPPMPMHAEPGKRELYSQLGWLLDLLNTDISALPTGGFLNLLSEILLFLYKDEVRPPENMKRLCVDTDLNRKAVERIQELMKNWMDMALRENQRSLGDGGNAYKVEGIVMTQVILVKSNRVSLRSPKRLVPYDVGINLRNFMGQYKPLQLESGKEANQDYIDEHFSDVKRENYAFFSTCHDPDITTTIQYTLVQLLTHFHLDCIRKCPECQKYYKSTKKKESPLCTRCLNRANTYKWRNKNRETYNEYQRNLFKGINDERPTEIRNRLAKGPGGEGNDR